MSELESWKTLNRRLLLDRSPWMRVYEDDVELPDGRVIHGYLRLETPGYAMIVPVDDAGRIGLVRSYKRGVEAIDLQPPAGVIDAGEDPLECAQRELLEELGCKATQLHTLGAFVLSGNYHAGTAHIYLATGCSIVTQPDSGDLEEQQVVWLPWQEAQKRWKSGEFQQISTVAALGLAFSSIDALYKDGAFDLEAQA
jgi:ADP-ribose pyrophosphatase